MTDVLSKITSGDIETAKATIPRAFSRTPKEKLQHRLIWAVLIGLVIYCLWAFNFSPARE